MNRLSQLIEPHFRFEKDPLVSAWSEGGLVLPKEMSPRSPGPLSWRARPWARPIMDCAHADSGVRKCDLSIAVQMGKTTMMAVIACYRMKYSPVPIMIVGGMSSDFAKREISEKRLHPLIAANEQLRVLKPRNQDQFKKLEMMMAYCPVLVTGAGSDTNLAGATMGIVMIDEASKIEHKNSEDAPEAHPVRLAEDRTSDFIGQEFIWKSSTPNASKHVFWQDVTSGTFTHFYVPCPHCGEYFPFEFESRSGDEIATAGQLEATAEEAKPKEYRSVIWSPDARNRDGTWDEAKIRSSTHYVCPHNGCRIVDTDKPGMMEKFEEHHENAQAPMSHRSFRVPSFYSPRRTFADLAMKFTSRKGDLFNTGMQVFFNHELAKTWEDIDVRVDEQAIWDCRASGDMTYLRGQVPPVSGLLYAGADWGQKETHWVVGMIDDQENIWVIDWGTVLSENDLLQERHQWKYARVAKPDQKITPRFGFIDSGDNTKEIYSMCQKSGQFWWPTKGSEAASGVLNEQRLKQWPGLSLYTYVDKIAKDDLYEMRIFRKKGRRLYLPADVTHDLIRGLSGQERIDKGLRSRWKKVKEDHYGDAIKEILVQGWHWSPNSAPT